MTIVDIGAVIATIATVISAIYGGLAYHSRQKAEGSAAGGFSNNLPIFIMVALAILAWGAVAFDYYDRSNQQTGNYVEGWNASPPVYVMQVNTKYLIKYKSSHRLMTLERVNYADRDVMTDTIIEKSGLYSITGGSITLAHPTAKILKFAPLAANQIQMFLLLIPNTVLAENIKSLSDVERLGGKILNGVGQVVIGGPADPQDPPTSSIPNKK
jgi:hypothetical protein